MGMICLVHAETKRNLCYSRSWSQCTLRGLLSCMVFISWPDTYGRYDGRKKQQQSKVEEIVLRNTMRLRTSFINVQSLLDMPLLSKVIDIGTGLEQVQQCLLSCSRGTRGRKENDTHRYSPLHLLVSLLC